MMAPSSLLQELPRITAPFVSCAVKSRPLSKYIPQVNSETDFVARNVQFSSLVSQIAQAALRQKPSDASARA